MTLEAQRQLQQTSLSKREIIRRLETSPAQFYRLIDQTNYSKSIDKVLALLQVLGCDVEMVVRSHDREESDDTRRGRVVCGLGGARPCVGGRLLAHGFDSPRSEEPPIARGLSFIPADLAG